MSRRRGAHHRSTAVTVAAGIASIGIAIAIAIGIAAVHTTARGGAGRLLRSFRPPGH